MKPSREQRRKEADAIGDKDIDYSDIPELGEEFWSRAVIKHPRPKKPVTLRVDADVLEWFQSEGKGYQTRINAVLRSYYEARRRKAS